MSDHEIPDSMIYVTKAYTNTLEARVKKLEEKLGALIDYIGDIHEALS